MSALSKTLLPTIVLGAILISAPNAKADVCSVVVGNLVQNCGFETGDFTGWTLSGNLLNNGVGNFPPGPNSGNFDAFFSSVGSLGILSQSIATTPGTTYQISFFLRNQSSNGPNSFSAFFGGVQLGSTLTNSPAFGYMQFTFSVVATAPTSVLRFEFRHDPSEWFLDDVSVTAVPEPTTMLLLGTGLVGASGFLRYSRRRQRMKQ